MIADCHMHTSFSTDSKARPEEMIERAIALGMKEICITDHYDMDYPRNPRTGEKEFQLDTPAYQAKIRELQLWRGTGTAGTSEKTDDGVCPPLAL